jgi:hypothetical protein
MAEGEIILYRADDGSAHVQLTEMDGTVWMSQAEIAALYQISPQAVTQHIRAIHTEGELTEEATCKQDLQVRTEGKRRVSRSIKLYRLEMILDFAEDRISQRKHLTLEDWRTNVDRFITFNERPLLNNAGRTSHDQMKRIAHDRYETFDRQRRQSDALAADAKDMEDLKAIETAAKAAKRETKR